MKTRIISKTVNIRVDKTFKMKRPNYLVYI